MPQSKIAKIFFWASCGFLIILSLVERAGSVSASFPKADEVITAQVHLKIAADPVLAGLHLDISTANAIVSIKGNVDTVAEAKKLVTLVYSIAGVIAVDPSRVLIVKLVIPPGMRVPRQQLETLSADSIITSLVLGLYIREGLIDAAHPERAIHVQTQQGIVLLSGTVSDDAIAAKALDLAQTIPGVVKVKSTLVIQ